MSDFFSVYIYFGLIFVITMTTLCVSALFRPINPTKTKYMPYESGILTQTHLMQERFPMRHYLIALIFLVFDIEVIFLYPWAAVAKQIGAFAFYEMLFFMAAMLIGLAYIWRKGGLQWQ